MPGKPLTCVLLSLGLLACGSRAVALAPLVIDDFTAGEGFDVTLQAGLGPGPSQPFGNRIHVEESGLDPQHVAGGARTLDVQSCITVEGPTTPVVHDPTAGTFSVGGTADCQLCEGPGFRYGGNAFEPKKALNLAPLSEGYGAVSIDLVLVNPGEVDPRPLPRDLEVSVWLGTHYTNTQGEPRVASVSFRLPIPTQETPQRLVMPFAAFGSALGGGGPSHPEFSFDKIDQIYLYFGPFGEGLHLAIDDFSFIENPSTRGDYNGDGQVNAEDYAVWRDTYNSQAVIPGAGADGNGDGQINAADYAVWRDNYAGETVSFPVPEARAWVMLATLVAMLCRCSPSRHCCRERTAAGRVSLSLEFTLQRASQPKGWTPTDW